MKYELKPCPFCGSTTAPTIMTREEADWICDPEEQKMYDGEIPMVVCCAAKKGGCGASTGFCNDDEEDFGRQAAEAWNKRASGWIPCSERLPEPNVIVRVKGEDFEEEAFWGRFTHQWIDFISGTNVDNVTHWMPLPEPPEGVRA